MKVDFDTAPGVLTVRAYGAGWIQVGDRRIEQPCVVSAQRVATDILPPRASEITAQHLELLQGFGADIIILGTGSRQHFIDHALIGHLAAQGIGLEIMDTGAACRSYNVLAGEERAVIAALYML